MLTIRFNRTGKKNRPYFRVVLQEHTKAPGKRHVEILGSYDPHKKTTVLKKERILYWIGQGVKTSDVVHNLLVREQVIEGKKVAKKIPVPAPKEEPKAEGAAEAPKEEKPQEEAKSEAVAEAMAKPEVAQAADPKQEAGASEDLTRNEVSGKVA
jgi:small subunit ribosomal protein S16